MQQLYQTTLPVQQQQQQQLPQIFSQQQQQQPAPIMQQHAAQYLPPQLSPAPLQTMPSAQQDLMYQQQHQLYNSGNTTYAQMQQQQHCMQPTTTLPNQPHSVPQNQYQQQQQEQRYVARPNADGSLQLVAVYDGNPANNSHQPSSSPATHHTIYQGPPATQVTTGATNNNSSWSSASTQHQPQYYLQHPQQQQQTFVVSPTSTIPMGTAGLPRNVGPVGTPISTAAHQQSHLHPGYQPHHYHHQTHLPPHALYAPLSQPQQPLHINAAAPSIIPSVYQQQHQQQVVMASQQQQQPMARAPSGPFEVAPPPPPPQQHTQPFVYHTTASSSTAAIIAAQQQHNMIATNNNNNNNKLKNGLGLEEGKVYHGVVKRYNPTRGFGFLRTDDGVDVFVHQSCVNMCGFRALNVGARVVFSAGVVMGTLQAMDVSQETPYVPVIGFEGPSGPTGTTPPLPVTTGVTNSSTSDAPSVAAGGLLGIAPSTGNHALPSTSIIGKEHESLPLSESERARLLASFHLEDHSSSKSALQQAPTTATAAGASSIVTLASAPSTNNNNNNLMPTQLRLPSLCGGATAVTALPTSPTRELFNGIPMFSSPATTRVASPHTASYLSELPQAQQQQQQPVVALESENASALFASGLLSTHALPTSFVSTAATFADQATKQLPDDESEDPTNPLDRTGSSFAPSLLLSTASSAGNLQSVSRFMSGRSDTAGFLLQVQNPGFSTVQLAFGGDSSS